MFTNLKLCLATAIHNLKWVKITHIRTIWFKPYVNLTFSNFSKREDFRRQILTSEVGPHTEIMTVDA